MHSSYGPTQVSSQTASRSVPGESLSQPVSPLGSSPPWIHQKASGNWWRLWDWFELVWMFFLSRNNQRQSIQGIKDHALTLTSDLTSSFHRTPGGGDVDPFTPATVRRQYQQTNKQTHTHTHTRGRKHDVCRAEPKAVNCRKQQHLSNSVEVSPLRSEAW